MNILQRLEVIAKSISDIFAKIPYEIKKWCGVAESIVTKVNEALKSNTAIIITDLIPGDWDDNLRKEAIVLCEGLIKILKVVEEANLDAKVEESTKQGLLQRLNSDLIALQDGYKMPQNRYDFYSQYYFSGKK